MRCIHTSLTIPTLSSLAVLALASCAGSEAPTAESAVSEPILEDGWLQVGDAITLSNADAGAELVPMSPADLFARPAEFDDQAVLVQGTISKVCQASGCWFSFQQGDQDLYVFFEDAAGEEFVVPKDTAGSEVYLFGTFSAESDAGTHEIVASAVRITQD